MLSDLDVEAAVSLYLPLVGAEAIGAYLYLWRQEPDSIRSHEAFFKECQLTPGKAVADLSALEACALVQTYVRSDGGLRLFQYELYSPKSPREFFADPLFSGTLQKYVGKERWQALADRYKASPAHDREAEKASTDFLSYFNPDFDDRAYSDAVVKTGGRASSDADIPFSEVDFLAHLSSADPRFSSQKFGREELRKIGRLAALYGYDAETMADFVSSHFDFKAPLGKRVDFEKVEKECEESLKFAYLKPAPKREAPKIKGENALANSLRDMQRCTPIQYLSMLQKGHKPAPADIRLIKDLTLEMGLTNEVCNALVLYTLTKQNNTLPRAYCEKVAATLVRQGITTALDAVNYFSSTPSKKKAKAKEAPKEKAKEQPKPDESGGKSLDDMLSSFSWEKKK